MEDIAGIAESKVYIGYDEVFELAIPLELIGNPKEVTIRALWVNTEDDSESDGLDQPISLSKQS